MRRDYRFAVRHPAKQRIILRALNEMQSDQESADETQAVTEMVTELEALLRVRRRVRKLQPAIRRKRRVSAYAGRRSY